MREEPPRVGRAQPGSEPIRILGLACGQGSLDPLAQKPGFARAQRCFLRAKKVLPGAYAFTPQGGFALGADAGKMAKGMTQHGPWMKCARPWFFRTGSQSWWSSRP